MQRHVTIFAIITLVLATTLPAVASHESGYSMQVLVNGRPLTEHLARGTTYIEAQEAAEYSVRISNHTGRRIAVALSIDGLNSIDAKTTTALEATKWVIGPWQTITVDGWQTDPNSARHFFFTTEARSYGAWLGKTTNLGVIEAVVYREVEQRPPRWSGSRDMNERSRKVPIPDPTPDQPSAKAEKHSEESIAGDGLSDDLAATGIGRELDNPVRRVEFKTERQPVTQFRLRYEYRPQLVSLGVLPNLTPPLNRRERANGFQDFSFAPDPYGRMKDEG